MTDILKPSGDQPAGETSLFTVGERSYDANAAKTKIENADAHILKIEEENARMRAEMEALRAKADQATTIDDALERMRQQQQPAPSAEPTPSAEPQPLDMEALLAQAREAAQRTALEQVQATQLAATQTSNMNESIAHAKTQYGDDFPEKLKEVGSQIGLDEKGINELAKTNPAMFKRLFQAPRGTNTPSPEGQSAFSRPAQNANLTAAVDSLFGDKKPFGGSEKAKAWLEAERAVQAEMFKK